MEECTRSYGESLSRGDTLPAVGVDSDGARQYQRDPYMYVANNILDLGRMGKTKTSKSKYFR